MTDSNMFVQVRGNNQLEYQIYPITSKTILSLMDLQGSIEKSGHAIYLYCPDMCSLI